MRVVYAVDATNRLEYVTAGAVKPAAESLPIDGSTRIEPIGSGGVYNIMNYRRWLAALWIGIILALIYIVTRISGVVSAFGAKQDDPRQIRPTI